MNKQDSVDLLHPSMLQIQYLMELEKVGKKRGSVTMIADICGVSHGPVSRFFKECMENRRMSAICLRISNRKVEKDGCCKKQSSFFALTETNLLFT